MKMLGTKPVFSSTWLMRSCRSGGSWSRAGTAKRLISLVTVRTLRVAPSAEMGQPGMGRRHRRQRVGKPRSLRAIERWVCSSEVSLVLGAQAFALVEQLHLRRKHPTAATRRRPGQLRDRAADPVVATIDPLITVDVGNHQLEPPRVAGTAAYPDVVHLSRQLLPHRPRSQRARWIRGVRIPLGQCSTDRDVVRPQDLYVDVLVIAGA